MVTNLMHNIWKGLAPSPIKALFTRSNEIHEYNTTYAANEIMFRKKLSWKFSNALLQELDRC